MNIFRISNGLIEINIPGIPECINSVEYFNHLKKIPGIQKQGF